MVAATLPEKYCEAEHRDGYAQIRAAVLSGLGRLPARNGAVEAAVRTHFPPESA